MIPVRDDQPRFSTPYVTYFLIIINILIFLYERTLSPRNLASLEQQFGLVPAAVAATLSGRHGISLSAALLPLFTSMFLHGGWLHVLGNVWVLWVFGDNIEDYLGHFLYILFYLSCGVGAAVSDIMFNWGSRIPTVGASGAIAGVTGAYLMLYPRARVVTIVSIVPLVLFFSFFLPYPTTRVVTIAPLVLFLLVVLFFPRARTGAVIPLLFLATVWTLPAWVVLGYWFIIQLFSGAASSVVQAQQGAAGGIAFWAHVGGFILGMVLIKVFPERSGRYRYGAW
jgi:membrane associated rhomboid family serine protease